MIKFFNNFVLLGTIVPDGVVEVIILTMETAVEERVTLDLDLENLCPMFLE